MSQLNLEFDGGVSVGVNPHAIQTLSKTQEIAHAFMNYARTNKIKPNTKAYRWAEHAFLCGVGSALGEDMPPLLSICLASGRPLESIITRTQPR